MKLGNDEDLWNYVVFYTDDISNSSSIWLGEEGLQFYLCKRNQSLKLFFV